jgi:hypothetical protein
MRLTLNGLIGSGFAELIGECPSNLPVITRYANSCDLRLVMAGGETGWWGGWKRVQFAVSRAHPYITMARQFARIINMDVCRSPTRVNNEFYEMLEGGPGLREPLDATQHDWCGNVAGYERGTVPSMVDLTGTNQYLRVYLTDPADVGKRIFVSGAIDQDGNGIYTSDGAQRVNGFFMTLASPFTTSNFIVTAFSGIQKDTTWGDVLLKQVDATTNAEVLLSRYGPDELVPVYRRYYLDRAPDTCGNGEYPQITALCKLEHIPVLRMTDYFVIGNPEAMKEEAQSIRASKMESGNAIQLEMKHHARAIQLLQSELRHYQGSHQIAVGYAPFGKSRMSRKMIGTMV